MTNQRRDTEFNRRVGAALRSARIKAGYETQTDASRTLGISQSSLSTWESGHGTPDLANASFLATAYDTTLDLIAARPDDIDRAAALIRGSGKEG